MKKKLMGVFIIIVMIGTFIFSNKKIEENNYKLTRYTLKVLNVANDINQSAKILTDSNTEKEYYDMYSKELITKFNSLGTLLYSGSVLIDEWEIDDYKFYQYTDTLYAELKYGNEDQEIDSILDNIIKSTDILIKHFGKYYGSEEVISDKELKIAIIEALSYIV